MNYRKGFAHGRAHSLEVVQEASKLRQEGLSLPKIASQTGIPLDTLKHWFSRKKRGHFNNEN